MKPILVAYVNVGNKAPLKAKQYIAEFRAQLVEQLGKEISILVIPISSGQTRVEYLNPTSIVSDSLKTVFSNVEKNMNEMGKVMDKTFDEMGKSMDKFSERMEKAFEAFKQG